MIEHIGMLPGAIRATGARSSRAAVPLCGLALLLLLGACGSMPFGARNAAAPAASAPPGTVVGNDPVVAFAAQAQPGSSDRIVLAGGQPASVRVTRAYISANGRECREVAVGSGMSERQRLVCATEAGWAEVRPLLRGGGTARP
jgi:hypothetical protein